MSVCQRSQASARSSALTHVAPAQSPPSVNIKGNNYHVSNNNCKNPRGDGYSVHKCSGSRQKCVSLRYNPSNGKQGNKISG